MKITVEITEEEAALIWSEFWKRKTVTECVRSLIEERAHKAKRAFGTVDAGYQILQFREAFPEQIPQVEAPRHNGVGEGDSSLPG